MEIISGLKCRECGERYRESLQYLCEECFGPLAVDYDYGKLAGTVEENRRSGSPGGLASPLTLQWIRSDLPTGGTPLVRAEKLGKVLGIRELYLKDEGASYPTLSFKDRVVASALTKARDFGLNTVACASTGNLANALAARAAAAGLLCVLFIPAGSDVSKISQAISSGAIIFEVQAGYDETNRLCSEVQEAMGWAVINGNLKPYYLEGVKSLAYEIMHDMSDRPPAGIVLPMGGGGLLSMMWQGMREMQELGLLRHGPPALIGAQARGAAPIVKAWLNKSEDIMPVKPDTAVASIAIGDPPDGFYAIRAMKESGGSAAAIDDDDAFQMADLLAKEEGIVTGGAGGVALCAASQWASSGQRNHEGPLVVVLTDRGPVSTPFPGASKEGAGSIRKVEAKLSAFTEIWNQSITQQSKKDV